MVPLSTPLFFGWTISLNLDPGLDLHERLCKFNQGNKYRKIERATSTLNTYSRFKNGSGTREYRISFVFKEQL
jgi:hypothetical protein